MKNFSKEQDAVVTNMGKHRWAGLLLGAVVAITAGCGVDDRCPGDDVEFDPEYGVCAPVPTGGMDGDMPDSGMGDTGDNGGVDFGATCSEDADCGPGICLNAPVMVGCTQQACDEGQENAGVCPSDWMCLADPATGDSACIKF